MEGTLEVLLRNGVYLSIGEFKGRKPVKRGSMTFALGSEDLVNPLSEADFLIASGGSRGSRTVIPMDLTHVREGSIDVYLCLMAQNGIGWSHITWNVPGTAAVLQVLTFKDAGSVDVDWFSQVNPWDTALHPRYRWSARALHWAGQLAGTPMPRPVHASLEDPGTLLHRIRCLLEGGNTPHRFVQCKHFNVGAYPDSHMRAVRPLELRTPIDRSIREGAITPGFHSLTSRLGVSLLS